MIYRTSSDGCFRVLLTQLKNVVTTQHTVFIYIKHLLESNSFKFCHPYLNFTEIDYSWWLYTVSNHRVLQRAMRELCNEWQVNFCNEQLLQRAMSYLGTSNNWKVTLKNYWNNKPHKFPQVVLQTKTPGLFLSLNCSNNLSRDNEMTS